MNCQTPSSDMALVCFASNVDFGLLLASERLQGLDHNEQSSLAVWACKSTAYLQILPLAVYCNPFLQMRQILFWTGTMAKGSQ